MNPRCPTVALTTEERARLVTLTMKLGPRDAARAVGIYDVRTLQSATFGTVSRQTAGIIRHSLDRI